MMTMVAGDAPEMASIVNYDVPVDGGTTMIRVYTPMGLAQKTAAHLYFHGGGFFSGTPEAYDVWCQHLANGAGCIVASASYRLAPESKFPTAAEDAYGALTWLVKTGQDLGVDPRRISIGGASSGGNLAAVVSLMARDRQGPDVVAQILEVPVLDLTMSCPSYQELANGYLLTHDRMREYIDQYLEHGQDASNPYASPMLAEDLAGLPPALIITCEMDPLRDEGEEYGRRLIQAGVPTTTYRATGLFHGSHFFASLVPDQSEKVRTLIVSALRQARGFA
jgi:acetyl esterase